MKTSHWTTEGAFLPLRIISPGKKNRLGINILKRNLISYWWEGGRKQRECKPLLGDWDSPRFLWVMCCHGYSKFSIALSQMWLAGVFFIEDSFESCGVIDEISMHWTPYHPSVALCSLEETFLLLKLFWQGLHISATSLHFVRMYRM